jgi:hypothetical protein
MSDLLKSLTQKSQNKKIVYRWEWVITPHVIFIGLISKQHASFRNYCISCWKIWIEKRGTMNAKYIRLQVSIATKILLKLILFPSKSVKVTWQNRSHHDTMKLKRYFRIVLSRVTRKYPGLIEKITQKSL